LKKFTDCLEFLCINSHGIVSACSLNYPTGIINLTDDKVLRKGEAGRCIICSPILFPAQKYVAIHFADHASLKSPLRAHKGHGNIILRTFPHKRRASSCIAKGCNLLKIMQWKAGQFTIITQDHDIPAIQRKICFILIDKKRIQKRLHPSASLLSR